MRNHAFQRAMSALSHPVSIGALLLLLLNDQVWRRVSPSWFTGKIGDFAWLIFAPFLLAAILACLPKRLVRDEGTIRWTSIIGTGLIFALVKTVPIFHAGFAELFRGLMGWTPTTLLDPTDLLALPALLIAWLVWEDSTTSFTFHSHRGWLMLALGVLATTANMGPAVDTGVICLIEQDSRIAAISYVDNTANPPFFSDDGGMTWREGSLGKVECPDQYRSGRIWDPVGAPWQINDPTNVALQYRFTRGVTIDSSHDGGQTWWPEFNLGGEEARIHLIQRALYTLPVGPFDAMIHSPSGNLVVAMGREGVLVRTAQGEWRWVTVGTYSVPELNRFDQILSLLSGEIWLAAVLAVLAVSTLAPRARSAGKVRARQVLASAVLVVAWSGWVFILLGFKPAVSTRGGLDPYPEPTSLAIGIVAVLAVALAIRQVRFMRRESPHLIAPTLIMAVVMMLVFLLPFVLWAQGVIPFYTSATAYSIALAAAVLVVARFYLRQQQQKTASSLAIKEIA